MVEAWLAAVIVAGIVLIAASRVRLPDTLITAAVQVERTIDAGIGTRAHHVLQRGDDDIHLVGPHPW